MQRNDNQLETTTRRQSTHKLNCRGRCKLETARKKSTHILDCNKRLLVSAIDNSQKREHSQARLQRKILDIIKDNKQKRALTYWIAERDC